MLSVFERGNFFVYMVPKNTGGCQFDKKQFMKLLFLGSFREKILKFLKPTANCLEQYQTQIIC